MEWLKLVLDYGKSDYLKLWWVLVGCYVVVAYFTALIFAHIGRPGRTLVHRCRQAWAWGFGFHLMLTLIIGYYWWQKFGVFKSFWYYMSLYILLVMVDLVFIGKLWAGLSEYERYTRKTPEESGS